MTMNLAAALIYWVIVAIWLTVLATIVYFYIRNPRAFGTTRLLLAVLCVDTVRNLVENIYFGLYFGSRYQLFPAELADYMGQPILLIVPKMLNVVAGTVVLGLLLFRWLPLAIKERGVAEQRNSDLEAIAAIDFLTGIYNRREFETLARAELARCQRYMRPLSVLLIDVDHFKAVNDRYGHAAGDGVLKNVVAIYRAEKRESDVLARLGGEEFIMMLPETTLSAAAQFAERLRRRVEHGSPAVYGESISVTVSIGLAGASIGASGIEELLRRADEALYEAKALGRNRVAISRTVDPGPAREAAE
jgi:diguanylate cyclase (GGDEF)-like protein